MSEQTRYAVIDIETTGTKEHQDVILEVGLIITDENLSELARRSYIINSGGAEIALSAANEFVRNMHQENGLAAELHTGRSKYVVVNAIIELLDTYGELDGFVLAGSGVSHFDRRFLEVQMPELMPWLRYYSIDVGITRRILRDICGREDLLLPEKEKNHRALDDALYHLEELRFIKAALASEVAS